MTSRERMLTALSNGRPDRLPCQVHGWMQFYLDTYLGGMDWWEANDRFGLDGAIYVSPSYVCDPRESWRVEHRELGLDRDGNSCWEETIHTPDGDLHHAGARNAITPWTTEYLIKSPKDFTIWDKHHPEPTGVDLSAVNAASEKMGDRGIIRSHPYSPGQGSPWQSFCTLYGTEEAILLGMDEPETLHRILESILERTMRVTRLWAGTRADMVELGGGAGSSTVISPSFFREFCLPYDQRQIEVFHEVGVKVVYHLCGGLMEMLDLVVETGADGLETMTPPSMGGNCDLGKASHRVGEKLFFIGGFDQNTGFEHGTPAVARRQVKELFEATRDQAGYICCPSDHFFHGEPANIEAFAQACAECVY